MAVSETSWSGPPPMGLLRILSLDSLQAAWAIVGITELGPRLQQMARSMLGQGRPSIANTDRRWRAYVSAVADPERTELFRLIHLDWVRTERPEVSVWTTVLRRWYRRPTTLDPLPLSQRHADAVAQIIRRYVQPELEVEVTNSILGSPLSAWDEHLIYADEYGYPEADFIDSDVMDLIWTHAAVQVRASIQAALPDDECARFEQWVAQQGRQFGGTGEAWSGWGWRTRA